MVEDRLVHTGGRGWGFKGWEKVSGCRSFDQ